MSEKSEFPATWRIASDYDPNQHLMSLKGKAYLDVQNRMIWFLRDQRDLIARGLATTSYVIRTELVEQDRQAGFAQFKTYVRDVLGNEATMYGSETAKDFGDYAEKASTKSLGRALAMLGYGTQFAAEMDEGERVVDSPVERRATPNSKIAPTRAPQPQQTAQTRNAPAGTSATPAASQRVSTQDAPKPDPDAPATAEQRERMRKYRDALEIADRSIAQADNALTVAEAEARTSAYIEQWKKRQMKQPAPGTYDSRAGLGDLSTLGNGTAGGGRR